MGTAYEERRGTLYNNRITYYGNVFAWVIHVMFLIVFWQLDVTTLAWSNVLSVLYYTLSFYFVHKRYYRTFFIGLFIEVVYNAIISTIVLGWGANVHYFILMVAYGVFFMPNVSRAIRIASTMLAMGIYGYLYVTVTDGTSPLSPTLEQIIGVTCLLATIALVAGLSFIFEGAVVEVTSELERSNEQLHTLASRDGLTGIYNRTTGFRLVEDKIRECASQGRPYAVVLADIDHFKAFNEQHGHDCGDLVLKQVASTFVRTKGIAIRWGGEEFLIFLADQSADKAAETTDRLRQRIKSLETIYDGCRLSVTMTFGVTTRNGFEAVDTLVKEADDRLRAGKQEGKDRIVT